MVHNTAKTQVKNKLSNDRIGVVTLANNDSSVGLEYNQKRQVEAVETRVKLAQELPNLFATERQMQVLPDASDI